MNKVRLKNLDFLRAGAIIMVLIFHITQQYADSLAGFWRYAQVGKFGVDLFFALSGYLIGGLFFDEKNNSSKVLIPRFIYRRVSRTVPPYLVALLISYLAVYFYRNQSFDFGYLFFLQNYYEQIPFFLISWSLCVEEHFYLILPFVLSFIFWLVKKPSLAVAGFLLALSLVPLWLRWHYQDITPESFGFYTTATHLRFDPLILGVGFAYLSIYFNQLVQVFCRMQVMIYVLTVVLLLSYSWWPREWMYSVGSYLYGLMFALCVVLASENKSWVVSKSKLIYMIAVSSYAIYLTHALTIHIMTRVFNYIGINNVLFQFTLTAITACLVGYVFYALIEKPILQWRRIHIPSYRTANKTSGYVTTNGLNNTCFHYKHKLPVHWKRMKWKNSLKSMNGHMSKAEVAVPVFSKTGMCLKKRE